MNGWVGGEKHTYQEVVEDAGLGLVVRVGGGGGRGGGEGGGGWVGGWEAPGVETGGLPAHFFVFEVGGWLGAVGRVHLHDVVGVRGDGRGGGRCGVDSVGVVLVRGGSDVDVSSSSSSSHERGVVGPVDLLLEEQLPFLLLLLFLLPPSLLPFPFPHCCNGSQSFSSSSSFLPPTHPPFPSFQQPLSMLGHGSSVPSVGGGGKRRRGRRGRGRRKKRKGWVGRGGGGL